MEYNPITGLVDIDCDSIYATSIESEYYNGITRSELSYLSNCQSNIQDQLFALTEGLAIVGTEDIDTSGYIHVGTDLVVNNDVTIGGNILWKGNDMQDLLDGKQDLITSTDTFTIDTLTLNNLVCNDDIICNDRIICNSMVANGVNVNDALNTKQPNITLSSDISLNSLSGHVLWYGTSYEHNVTTEINTINNNIALIELGKHDTITSSTDLSINDLSANNIYANNVFIDGLNVTTELDTINNNINLLELGKHGTITGTTDLSMNDLSANNVYANNLFYDGNNVSTEIDTINNNIALLALGKHGTITSETDLSLNELTANSIVTDVITLNGVNIESELSTINNQINILDLDITNLTSGKLETLQVGTVTTVPYGTPASVTIHDPSGNTQVIDFTIPRGLTGATGATGPRGSDGSDGSDGKDGKDGADGAPADLTLATAAMALATADAAGLVAIESQMISVGTTLAAHTTAIGALNVGQLAQDESILALQLKTTDMDRGITATTFKRSVQIGSIVGEELTFEPKVDLHTTEASSFKLGINSDANISANGVISCIGNLGSGGNLEVTGNTTLGTILGASTHHIKGSSIVIDCPFITLNGYVTGGGFYTNSVNPFDQLGY